MIKIKNDIIRRGLMILAMPFVILAIFLYYLATALGGAFNIFIISVKETNYPQIKNDLKACWDGTEIDCDCMKYENK